MSKKSLVALAHGLDVQENVTRVFDMMGGAAKMIEPNSSPTRGTRLPRSSPCAPTPRPSAPSSVR